MRTGNPDRAEGSEAAQLPLFPIRSRLAHGGLNHVQLAESQWKKRTLLEHLGLVHGELELDHRDDWQALLDLHAILHGEQLRLSYD